MDYLISVTGMTQDQIMCSTVIFVLAGLVAYLAKTRHRLMADIRKLELKLKVK